MFDYKQVLSLLFLFGTMIFTVYNWILFIQQSNKEQLVFRLLSWFNGFILVHATFGFITNLFFSELLFLDFGDPFPLFYAPFYMLILQAEINPHKDLRKRVWLSHFSLGILFFCLFVFLQLNQDLYRSYITVFIKIVFGTIGVQMIGYAMWGMFLIQKNRITGSKVKVRNLFLDALLVFSITGAFYFTSIHKVNKLVMGDIKSNVYTVNLFMLLVSIILHRVFSNRFSQKKVKQDTKTEELVADDDVFLDDKYSKSRLDDGLLKQYAVKIESLKISYFLKSDLNIGKMSEDLKITPHHLSQTFSIIFDCNYSQYVNKHRVSYAINLMKKEIVSGKTTYSISEVAFKSGFNSDSSFYRAFRESCGISPVQWRKREEAQQGKV